MYQGAGVKNYDEWDDVWSYGVWVGFFNGLLYGGVIGALLTWWLL